MEELNESKAPEVLESRAAVEEYELQEVSLADTTETPKEKKKTIDWLKVGVAGTLACSVLSLGFSCAALIKKNNDNKNNNQSSSNVNDTSSITISADGYLVIDGTKTNIKADGSSSEIVDAQVIPVDKWGISTYIMFTFADGSYMTTQPKEQVMNDHYYDAANAEDLADLAEYKVAKIRLTNNVNVATALEFGSSVEINLNNKTMTYSASAPIELADNSSIKFNNGSLNFSTAKALSLGKGCSLEIADATVSAQGTIAEVAGDDAKVELLDTTVSSTGKVIEIANNANNFVYNVEDSTLDTVDAGNVFVSTEAALREAVADANVTSITLSTNINFETGVYVKRNLTVDLNGKTLTSTNNTITNGIFTVFAGAKLTIEGNGTINAACQTNNYSMAVWAYGGEVVINGGTYTNVGAKDHDGTKPNNNELIYVSNGGKITINAGTFIGNSENETYGARYTLNAADGSTNPFVVKGGTFIAYNPAASASEAPVANFVDFGYKVVESNGTYTVVEETGHIYAANATELANAISNSNVTNITLSTNVTLTTTLNVARDVTINLNGKTITSNTSVFTITDGNITVDNGTINAYGDVFYVNATATGADVTLTLGTNFVATSQHDCCVYLKGAGAKLVTAATLTSYGNYATIQGNGNLDNKVESITVTGGSISHPTDLAIYAPQTGAINITAGTITGTTAIYVKSGTLNITGGTLVATAEYTGYVYNGDGTSFAGDALIIDACGYPGGNPVVTITGGTFTTTDTDGHGIGYYAYAGNTATITAEGYDIYSTTCVANLDDFTAAIADTTAAHITLAANITTATKTVVARDVTIDLNGKTITAPNGTGFSITNGVVTVDNGTVNAYGDAFYLKTTESLGTIFLTLGSKLIATSQRYCCVYALGPKINIITAATLTTSSPDSAVIQGNGKVQYSIESLTITGGRLEQTTGLIDAVYVPNGVVMTITGGTIIGANAVSVKSGTINISGGTFTATGTYTGYVADGNGTSISGVALSIEACDYPCGNPVVTITGGTFTTTDPNGYAIAYYSVDGNTATISAEGYDIHEEIH